MTPCPPPPPPHSPATHSSPGCSPTPRAYPWPWGRHHPHRAHPHPARRHRPRPHLHLPRLRPTTQLVRRPPHHPMDRRAAQPTSTTWRCSAGTTTPKSTSANCGSHRTRPCLAGCTPTPTGPRWAAPPRPAHRPATPDPPTTTGQHMTHVETPVGRPCGTRADSPTIRRNQVLVFRKSTDYGRMLPWVVTRFRSPGGDGGPRPGSLTRWMRIGPGPSGRDDSPSRPRPPPVAAATRSPCDGKRWPGCS